MTYDIKPLSRRAEQLKTKLMSLGKDISFEEMSNLKEAKYMNPVELEDVYNSYVNGYDNVDTDEEEFRKKIDELAIFSSNINRILSQNDFDKYTAYWKGKGTRSLQDWYKYYYEELHKQPGWTTRVDNDVSNINYTVYRSPIKRRKLIKDTIVATDNPIADRIKATQKANALLNQEKSETYLVNSFPLKENKKYYTHIVHNPGTYYMDIMFTGSFGYLLCINANTRYLYQAPLSETFNFGEAIRQGTKAVKDTASFIRAFNNILAQGMKPVKLIGDSEGCFRSEAARNEYNKIGATFQEAKRMIKGAYPSFMPKEYSKTEPLHTSLGIIDRVTRTLRDMAYNAKIGVIDARQMESLVEIYNNAPHVTLSKYAGEQVTPKQVQSDYELEKFIMRRICQENFNIKKQDGYQIGLGEYVNVYNDTDQFDKRRTMIQPYDNYISGYENGMYIIRNHQNHEVQYLPRARIQPRQFKTHSGKKVVY